MIHLSKEHKNYDTWKLQMEAIRGNCKWKRYVGIANGGDTHQR